MSWSSPRPLETQGRQDPVPDENSSRFGRSSIVLVPLDGSEEAKTGLLAARVVAEILGVSIHVVHAAEEVLSHSELLRRTGLSPEETRGLVIDQAFGTASDGIVRLAEEKSALLIAMTTRGHTAYLGRTVRPAVEQIISEAPCPVLLVRPEIGQRIIEIQVVRQILLPLDGAPSSAAVIGLVLELAHRTGAKLNVVYVATQAKRPEERGTLTTPLYIDQPQYEWPAWAMEFLRRFCTSLGRHPLPESARLFVRRGEPANEILNLALGLDVDLIALEWRGHLGPPHAAVARAVLREAHCPVLLFRTRSPAVPIANSG